MAHRGGDFFALAKRWFIDPSTLFFDIDRSIPFREGSHLGNLLIQSVRLSVSILIGYALFFLCRRTPKRIWLFILTLIGGPVVALVLPDVIFGGRRSSLARYWIPCYVGIQLSVAYLLATQVASPSFSKRTVWRALGAVLIMGGVVSCTINSQAEMWWNKGDGSAGLRAARIINQAAHPLLIIAAEDTYLGKTIALSRLLEPKVRLRLVVDPNMLRIPDGFTNVFLFRPSDRLRQKLEKEGHYKVEAVSLPAQLWRVVREPYPGA